MKEQLENILSQIELAAAKENIFPLIREIKFIFSTRTFSKYNFYSREYERTTFNLQDALKISNEISERKNINAEEPEEISIRSITTKKTILTGSNTIPQSVIEDILHYLKNHGTSTIEILMFFPKDNVQKYYQFIFNVFVKREKVF